MKYNTWEMGWQGSRREAAKRGLTMGTMAFVITDSNYLW